MKRWSLAALTAGCALFALGCGDKKVQPVARVKVSGKVAVDGKAVSSGAITFDAMNGQPPSESSILDGKYEGLAPVGKCKVMISSTIKMTVKEKTGKDGPGHDTMAEYNLLPDRYNAKSEIYREVTEPGPHVFDFAELKGK